MSDLIVYVPRPDTAAAKLVRPQSAVVGRAAGEAGRIDAYLQDDDGFGDAFAHFANRVQHAAGRLTHRAPTIARAQLSADELIAVGRYDDMDGEIQLGGDGAAELAKWLGQDEIQPEQLLTKGTYKHDMRRQIIAARSSGDPKLQAMANHLAKTGNFDF